MTQYIVYQDPPDMGLNEQPDPVNVMARLTESDSPANAVHNVVNSGALTGGSVNVVDVSSMATYDVSVKATISGG